MRHLAGLDVIPGGVNPAGGSKGNDKSVRSYLQGRKSAKQAPWHPAVVERPPWSPWSDARRAMAFVPAPIPSFTFAAHGILIAISL